VRTEPVASDDGEPLGAEITAAINASDPPVHPQDPRLAGCRHVVFHAPGTDGADARNATSIHPELALGQLFVNESVIAARFTGRLVGDTPARRAAGGRARDHRPRMGHRHGAVPARGRGPVPAGFAL